MNKWTTLFWLAVGVAAAAVANLLVNHYGPSSTPYVAFGLIGADLVVRDRLHLNLSGLARWGVIGVLIALGSLVTYIINADAGDIALASVCAFSAALVVDTLVFSVAKPLGAQRRVNVSNTFGAATDTLIFFSIAFGLGVIPFVLLFGQFTAKIAGGAIWGLFLVREEEEEHAMARSAQV